MREKLGALSLCKHICCAVMCVALCWALVGLEQWFKMRLRKSRRPLSEGPFAVQCEGPPDQGRSKVVSGVGMLGRTVEEVVLVHDE